MTKLKIKTVHTISFLVANKPGVLARISLTFARRGYNIDSLVVSPTVDPKFSRMTITASGDPDTLDQIIKQTQKLVDVVHAEEHTDTDAVHRELALMKVKSTPANKPIITNLAKKYDAQIIDENEKMMIIAQTGITDKLDEFESLIKKYGVTEMVRSGKIVIARGKEST